MRFFTHGSRKSTVLFIYSGNTPPLWTSGHHLSKGEVRKNITTQNDLPLVA